jgi:16S rRNA (uracil1498-N3)-methyltransferase
MTRAPRFIIADQTIVDGVARVTGAEFHHLRAVRRLSPGDPLEIVVAAGTVYIGRIERFEPQAAIVTIEGAVTPIGKMARIILAVAMIKGPRMDFIVEKAAELGADELWPLETMRGVVRGPSAERRERWVRLAEAAAKQCLGNGSMTIAAPLTVAAMTAIVPAGALAILCAQGGAPLGRIVRERHHLLSILIACGPEGDFDDAEKAQMTGAGFTAAGLGPNRLRSETAALAALSIVTGTLAERSCA